MFFQEHNSAIKLSISSNSSNQVMRMKIALKTCEIRPDLSYMVGVGQNLIIMYRSGILNNVFGGWIFQFTPAKPM